MIITITQTHSLHGPEYTTEWESKTYHATVGGLLKRQTVTLSRGDTELCGRWSPTHWTNHIPLRHLFGVPRLSRSCHVTRNGQDEAIFLHSLHGFGKAFYVIALWNNTVLHGYDVSRGEFNNLCLYDGEYQIGLIETYLTAINGCYSHKIYLLDGRDGGTEYAEKAEVLALFAIYYANHRFVERGSMYFGTKHQKEWTMSKYNNRYDPAWRETHFPDENFFGKLHLFD